MIISTHHRRSTTARVRWLMLLIWLVALSVGLFSLLLGLDNHAQRQDLESVEQHLQQLDERLTVLAELQQTLQAQPKAAGKAELDSLRQAVEDLGEQVDGMRALGVTQADLEAIRSELAQLVSRQARPAATPAPPRPRAALPTANRTNDIPFPFRVVGAELRAERRTLSIVPYIGAYTAEQIQVLMPGEALGVWRLQAIEDDTAVFRSGEQLRRVAIP